MTHGTVYELFALAITGGVGLGGAYIGGRQSRKAALEAESARQRFSSQQQSDDVVRSARLVADELARNEAKVSLALSMSSVPGLGQEMLVLEQSVWCGNRAVLASPVIDDTTWNQLTKAYARVEALNHGEKTEDGVLPHYTKVSLDDISLAVKLLTEWTTQSVPPAQPTPPAPRSVTQRAMAQLLGSDGQEPPGTGERRA